jgi:hypothetical protein
MKSLGDHSRPIHIFKSAFYGPVRWRTRRDRAQIAGFVSELENFSPLAFARSGFDLFVLPYGFRKAFVVCDLFNE